MHPDAMTRSDLVALLAERSGQLTHRDAEFAVKTMLDAMSDALARGHRIEIRGFGSFVIKKRAKKIGRHIKKGKSIEIPEHFIPSFKPAKVFVEQVKSNVTALPEDESED